MNRSFCLHKTAGFGFSTQDDTRGRILFYQAVGEVDLASSSQKRVFIDCMVIGFPGRFFGEVCRSAEHRSYQEIPRRRSGMIKAFAGKGLQVYEELDPGLASHFFVPVRADARKNRFNCLKFQWKNDKLFQKKPSPGRD